MDQCFDRTRSDLKPVRNVFIGRRSFAVNRIEENVQRFELGCFSLSSILLTQSVQYFGQERHRVTMFYKPIKGTHMQRQTIACRSTLPKRPSVSGRSRSTF